MANLLTRKMVLGLLAAALLTAAAVAPAWAVSCQTYCYYVGNQKFCNTNCY